MRVQGKAPAKPAVARPAAPTAKPVVPTARPVAPAAKPVAWTAKPVAPPAAPLARPVAAPARAAAPVARPEEDIDVDLVEDAPPPPPAAPVPDAGAFATDGPLVKPRGPRRRTWGQLIARLAVIGFVLLLAAGIVLGAGYYVFFVALDVNSIGGGGGLAGSGASTFTGLVRNLNNQDEKAFRLVLSRDTWAPGKELSRRLGALTAWKHKEADVWFAVAVKDYGTQRPRDAELVKQGMERLAQHFGDNLELAAKTEPTDFAGEQAQALTFKGAVGAVNWWGKCILFTQDGIGYWFIAAGPTLDELRPHLAKLKADNSFTVVTDRRGWREQPPRMETFAAANGAFSLTAPASVWEKYPATAVEFEGGVLYLFGRFLQEKDNAKNAHLQAFTMDKQADLKEALKAARTYIERLKKEQNSNYKFELAGDEQGAQSEQGLAEDIGARPGRLIDLKMLFGETPSRFYLLGVVNEGPNTVVFVCDCTWQSRQIWRQDFMELLRSYKSGRSGE
jgi:hypothetical protein